MVVSVLGLLAGISIPNLIKAREGSAATLCKTNRSIIADAIRIWATKEEDSIAGIQAKFGISPATVDVTAVAGDNVEEYFNPAEAICPLDSTQHYTSTIDNNGLITITCPTHGN